MATWINPHMMFGLLAIATWLTETPGIAERCPTLTPLGKDYQLTVWGARGDDAASYALLDGRVELISGPTKTALSDNTYSRAISMPDGSIAWTYAERDATKVEIVVAK